MLANRKHMKFNGLFEYFLPFWVWATDAKQTLTQTQPQPHGIRNSLFAIRNSLLACAITLEEILGISGENPFVTMLST